VPRVTHAEPLARWIIEKAVKRLPAGDCDRFREEWLAHLDETPGTLRKLWHAFGCHLGAAKLAGVLAQQTKRVAKPVTVSVERRHGRFFLYWNENESRMIEIKTASEDELKAWGIIPPWASLKKDGE
jgi:hypothetical protein